MSGRTSGPRRLTRQRPGVLCPAQCLPHQHRETRIGAKLATCIHCAWRTPPFHANDAIVAPNAPGPPAADSVAVCLRPWAKTHLPARARMGGSAHQSLFTFDPCDSSEPKLSLTIRLANSVLLKASFCGVLGLEWHGSWRRGIRSKARAEFAGGRGLARKSTPPCRARRTFMSSKGPFDDHTSRDAPNDAPDRCRPFGPSIVPN